MSKTKSTFIATVFNEEATIDSFLMSLISQSHIPDEIIIVDGGSKDRTFGILQEFRKQFLHKTKIKVYRKKGNRSVGRNYAISRATDGVIAVSDAGCILHRKWFSQITQPFSDKSIDVVSGYYRPKAESIFEKALSTYTSVMEDKVTEKFNPSSRSIAFRKRVWKSVGGYPEELDTCEDMVFVKRLREKGYIFFLQKKAIVYWRQKKTVQEAFRQFYGYAKGDGQARYIRPQTYVLYLRYLLLGTIILYYFGSDFLIPLLLSLFILYSLWAVSKNYKYVRSFRAMYLLPMLQYISDIAVLSGTTVGLFKKKI